MLRRRGPARSGGNQQHHGGAPATGLQNFKHECDKIVWTICSMSDRLAEAPDHMNESCRIPSQLDQHTKDPRGAIQKVTFIAFVSSICTDTAPWEHNFTQFLLLEFSL